MNQSVEFPQQFALQGEAPLSMKVTVEKGCMKAMAVKEYMKGVLTPL